MRTELYEKYKREHPEEMVSLNGVYDSNTHIESVRRRARAEKLGLIAEWERRLSDE